MKKTIRFVSAIILALLFSFSGAFYKTPNSFAKTETDGWSQLPLYGGEIYSIAIDPTNSSVIFTGGKGGVYFSSDGGNTWMEKSAGLNSTLVNEVVLDPVTPVIVYAVDYGIDRSIDGGNTWAHINNGITNLRMKSLVIDPITPTTLYACASSFLNSFQTITVGGIWKSTDSGSNWTLVSNDISDKYIQTLAIDPNNPNILYAGTEYGGIYKSNNSGLNWAAINNGFTDYSGIAGAGNISTITVDKNNSNILYTGDTINGIHMSTDAGNNWTKINNGLSRIQEVNCITINPSNSQNLYAGTKYGGIYSSIDQGATWALTNSGLTNFYVHAIVFNPSNTSFIYVGTNGKGIFFSAGHGTNWTPVNNGIYETDVYNLNSQTSALYAEVDFGGQFRSITNGSTWIAPAYGALTDGHLDVISADPSSPTTLYGGADMNGIYYSTNSGDSWAARNNGIKVLTPSAIVFNSFLPGNIYIGSNEGVYYTTDGGANWTETASHVALNITSLVMDPTNSSILYAGTLSGGIFKTMDGGETWASINNTIGRGIWGLVIEPTNHTTIYACSSYGIFKSTDSGTTWIEKNSGITDLNIDEIAINPDNSSIMYAVSHYSGKIFKSVDAGETWVSINSGFPNQKINSITLDKNNSSILYVGTIGGIWKHTEAVTYSNLTTGVSPSEGGIVNVSPAGPAYLSGTSVTLTAVPNSGYHFSVWSGDISDNTNPLTISLTSDKNITAVFAQGDTNYTLNISCSPVEGGSVQKNPNGGNYTAGTSVQVSAVPFSNYTFAGWSGDITTSTNPVTVSMDSTKNITANFVPTTPPPTNFYSIAIATVGSGTVIKNPNDSSYVEGTSVALTATPALGWKFTNWSGDSSSTNNQISITMNKSYNITANFEKIPSQGNTLDIAIVGKGSVTKNPDKASYDSTDIVRITAIPDSGWTFAGWSGDAEAEASSIRIVMNSPKNITATFEKVIGVKKWNVNISSSQNGSVTPNGRNEVEDGKTLQIYMHPDKGFGIGKLSVDGKTITLGSSDAQYYSAGPIVADCEIVCSFIPLTPETVKTHTIHLTVGSRWIFTGSKQEELDTAPIISNGRTLVPIRAIISALTGSIEWDAANKKVTITLGSNVIELWIGKNTATVNGVEVKIDPDNLKVVPAIINNRTMLPLRFITEKLGCTVIWDSVTKSIIISG